MQWYHKWASSLGSLEDTPENIWGTLPYDPEKPVSEPTVFCGLYGLPDFYSLWKHKGRRAIFWCGSDITHFKNGYWLEDDGKIRLNPKPLAEWIDKHCESWVENVVEHEALKKLGIHSRICPSFLGDINLPISYNREGGEKPKVYASVSGNNFKLYGWDVIERIAGKVPEVDFYLYGNTVPWPTKHQNVHIVGRVLKKEMNRQIRKMHCGFRPVEFDGASEILMKAVLMGHYAIARIPYPHIDSYSNDKELIACLKNLTERFKPNFQGRQYFMRKLNKFPWVKKYEK